MHLPPHLRGVRPLPFGPETCLHLLYAAMALDMLSGPGRDHEPAYLEMNERTQTRLTALHLMTNHALRMALQQEPAATNPTLAQMEHPPTGKLLAITISEQAPDDMVIVNYLGGASTMIHLPRSNDLRTAAFLMYQPGSGATPVRWRTREERDREDRGVGA